MNLYIGKTALDLTRSTTPDDLRTEAYWWCNADGNRGTKVTYAGDAHGIHRWQVVGQECEMWLRSKPKPMSSDDQERIERSMRWYMERNHEQMIDERTNRVFSYQDYEAAKQ